MSRPLVFRAAARTEFDNAAMWYDNQRAELGTEFVGEGQKIFDTISNQPDRYPIIAKDVRDTPCQQIPLLG